MDDIAVILQEAMRTELGILPKDYAKFSVVFIVPDHGDRLYVQEMTHLLLAVMGFKEIAVHQVSPSHICVNRRHLADMRRRKRIRRSLALDCRQLAWLISERRQRRSRASTRDSSTRTQGGSTKTVSRSSLNAS